MKSYFISLQNYVEKILGEMYILTIIANSNIIRSFQGFAVRIQYPWICKHNFAPEAFNFALWFESYKSKNVCLEIRLTFLNFLLMEIVLFGSFPWFASSLWLPCYRQCRCGRSLPCWRWNEIAYGPRLIWRLINFNVEHISLISIRRSRF